MRSFLLVSVALVLIAAACTDPVSPPPPPPPPRTPVVALTTAAQTVAENDESAEIAVSLDEAATATVVVSYTVAGNATGRHSLVDGSVTIAAGQTTATITVPLTDDALWNGGVEASVVVTLGTPDGATLGEVVEHTLAITDDEVRPVVTFVEASSSAREDAGTVSLAVRASGAATIDLEVPFTVSGTAGTDDIGLLPGTVTVPAGEQEAGISLAILDDDLFEGVVETVIVALGAQEGAATDAVLEHTVSIEDDETAPTVSFPVTTVEAGEAAGVVQVAVKLSGPSTQEVVVPVVVSASAEAGDFLIENDAVVIPAGEVEAFLQVALVDDVIYEGLSEDAIVVELQPATGAVLGDDHTFTLTILDDEEAPTAAFVLSLTTLSEGEDGLIAVELSHPSETAVTAEVVADAEGNALPDVDFTWPDGAQLVFAPYELQAAVAVRSLEDGLYEAQDESNVLLLAVTAGGVANPLSHTLVVEDVDALPSVELTTEDGELGEDAEPLTLEVRLSNRSAFELQVPFTVSGTADASDHSLRDGTITIVAGATSGTSTFAVTQDDLDEPDESMVVALSPPVGASLGQRTTLTLTFVDDDPTPQVSFADSQVTVREDLGTVTFDVTLSSSSAAVITVPYTRESSSPVYPQASGTIEFGPGETSATLTFDVIDNDEESAPIEVEFALGEPQNAVLGTHVSRLFTVVDDDLLLRFSADTLDLAAGAPVNEWGDAGPRGLDATLTAGTAPTFEPDVANGLPVVRFAGQSHLTTAPTALFGDSTARTFIAVVRPTEATTMSLLQVGAEGCGSARLAFDGVQTRFGVDAGCTDRTLASDGSAPLDELQILTFVVRNSTVPTPAYAYRNGRQLATGKHGNGFPLPGQFPTAEGVLAMGGGVTSGTVVNGFAGDLAELAVFEGEFLDSRRRKVECALATKYGLSGVIGCEQPCDAVRVANPAATDGEYLVPVPGFAEPVSVYCADLATDPKEYLTLAHTSAPIEFGATAYRQNCFSYKAGDARVGSDVMTCYERVRFDPGTLYVDRTDRRFALSVGDAGGIRTMNYASAGNCIWGSPESLMGHGLIDLTGTPFAISDDTSFVASGWYPGGNATISEDRKTAHLYGGGYCGDIGPTGGLLHLKPAP